MHTNFVKVSGGNIPKPKVVSHLGTNGGQEGSVVGKKTFAEIREKHPNAFRRWNAEEDEELKKLFLEKMSIPDLMKRFGRKNGAINARLGKLGLIEFTPFFPKKKGEAATKK